MKSIWFRAWVRCSRWLSARSNHPRRKLGWRRFHFEALEARLPLAATTVSTYRKLDFNYTATFNGTNEVPFYLDTYSGSTRGSGSIEFDSPTLSRPNTGRTSGTGSGSGADNGGPYAYNFSGDLAMTNNNGAITIQAVSGTTSWVYTLENSWGTGGAYVGEVPTTGRFNVSDYSLTGTWDGVYPVSGYNVHYRGSLTGSITDKITTATDLAVRGMFTNGGAGVEFNVDVTGKHMKAASQATAVTRAALYWSNSTSRSGVISEVAMPSGTNMNIYWNHGNLKVRADTLGAVPSGATHLLFVADPDSRLSEANENNNLVALPLHEAVFDVILASPGAGGFVYGKSFAMFASLKNRDSSTTNLPKGTVSFADLRINPPSGTYALATGTLAVSPAAPSTTSVSVSAPIVSSTGNHQLLVAYRSTGFHKGVATTTGLFEVAKASSVASIVDSVDPAIYGTNVVYTVNVRPEAGLSGIPTGSVQILDGSTVVGTVVLNRGTATFTSNRLVGGLHNISARYLGNSNFLADSSATITTQINRASTVTTLSTTRTTATFGQAVTYDVVVGPVAPSTGTPSGTVTLKAGTVTVGSGTLVNGRVSITTTSLPVGTQNVTAVYNSDVNFGASTSTAKMIVVSKGSPTITVVDSVDPAVYGQAVKYTARVVVPAAVAGSLSGTVTFKNATSTLATVTLVNGVAEWTTNALAKGTQAITAIYNGNSAFLTSSSTAIQTTINAANTSTTVTGPAVPVMLGRTASYTIQVTSVSPSTRVPVGTVTLKSGNTILGTATVSSNGTATISTTALPVGNQTVFAIFTPANANFLASTSSSVTTTITKNQAFISFTALPSPATFGTPVVLSASIRGQATGQALATGTITFFDGTTSLGTVNLVNGVASLTISTLSRGLHTLKAVYSGDARFTAVTSVELQRLIV